MNADKNHIREFRQEDYNEVISLWLSCGLIKSTKSATKEQLFAVSARNKGLFLVCEADGEASEARIIGTVVGTWDGWRAWIYKLAVTEEFRKKGIGTELVKEVSKRLRENTGPGTIVRAYIERENEASLALFKKLGFERMDEFVIVTQGRQ